MTELFKTLVHDYGILYVSLSTLEAERPGNPHASLNAYYETMGTPYEGPAGVMREKLAALGPDEPAIVVGISTDGSTHIRRFGDENTASSAEDPPSRIAVWELPEDEFYFFKAFRHGFFDLEKNVPAFLLQTAFVYAHTLFESYLTSILKSRLQKHPQQMGRAKQIHYGIIFDCASKEELMANIIEREVMLLMHEPIQAVLIKMRKTLGFRTLSETHDKELHRLSLTRNCLVHNASKVNDKLANAEMTMIEGQPITIQRDTISKAIDTYRQVCREIDQAFEALR